jgi:hypothetical protein
MMSKHTSNALRAPACFSSLSIEYRMNEESHSEQSTGATPGNAYLNLRHDALNFAV